MNNSNNMSSLNEAKKFLKIADHMVYITYPAMKEHRLLIKILEQVNVVQKAIISFILQNEYNNKSVKLYAEPKVNFQTFLGCSTKYGLSSENIDSIKQTAALIEMHSTSPMEFVRHDQFIIMSDNMHMESLTYEKVKNHLVQSKEMLENVEKTAKKPFP